MKNMEKKKKDLRVRVSAREIINGCYDYDLRFAEFSEKATWHQKESGI